MGVSDPPAGAPAGASGGAPAGGMIIGSSLRIAIRSRAGSSLRIAIRSIGATKDREQDPDPKIGSNLPVVGTPAERHHGAAPRSRARAARTCGMPRLAQEGRHRGSSPRTPFGVRAWASTHCLSSIISLSQLASARQNCGPRSWARPRACTSCVSRSRRTSARTLAIRTQPSRTR